MKSAVSPRFNKRFDALPTEIRRKAQKAYRLWLRDHSHPSLSFKKVGKVWSARIDDNYRAVGDLRGDTVHWFFVGTHREYELLLKGQ
jgi:hypothetical protein